MHGTANHTTGGLTKGDLKYNKWGRIVSRKKSQKAKKENRLVKLGFKAQKGKFGLAKKTRRGGAGPSDTTGSSSAPPSSSDTTGSSSTGPSSGTGTGSSGPGTGAKRV